MSKNLIAFFSTDYRDLYKGDIFRVLALPHEYVIEFRYQKRYLHEEILPKINDGNLVGQEGVIFFVSGNDPDLKYEERELDFYSIRKVSIKEVYYDKNIEIVNFYLKLGDFIDKEFHPKTDEEDLPVYTMVSPITLQDVPSKSWVNRVQEIDEEFNNSLFFHFNSVKQDGKTVKPKYSKDSRSTYFPLKDGKDYQLEISCYDPKSKSKLAIQYPSSNIDIYSSNGFEIDTIRKTLILDLKTNPLDTYTTSTITTFREEGFDKNRDSFIVNLNWEIKKALWKPLVFGFFTMLIFDSVILMNAALPSETTTNLSDFNWCIFGIASLLVAASSGMLFYLFNKK